MPTSPKSPPSLAAQSTSYLDFLEAWLRERPTGDLAQIIGAAGGPDRVAIVAVDLSIGFCHHGPLSSPRIAALLPRVTHLLTRAHVAGVRAFALPQDAHEPDAQEFASFPAHCVRDTDEARTAPELAELPIASNFTVIAKNSISSHIGTTFDAWDALAGPFTTYIVVGDCTDFCVYQAAMALKLRSNSKSLSTRVIVPADAVDTFDISLASGHAAGAQPHPGDLYHHIFLHSLATNGVEIVANIQ